uniref:Uncharacterized protein n=1 Tax=Anguilla anguilla TaxID=7936 RepID=A0A0E9PRC4_ANGAN
MWLFAHEPISPVNSAVRIDYRTVTFIPGPGGPQGLLIFVLALIPATNSDTRSQVR